jgi:hypothetical protein
MKVKSRLLEENLFGLRIVCVGRGLAEELASVVSEVIEGLREANGGPTTEVYRTCQGSLAKVILRPSTNDWLVPSEEFQEKNGVSSVGVSLVRYICHKCRS